MEQKQVTKRKIDGRNVNKIKRMEDNGGVTSLVHSPSLYQGKIYQSLFPRMNHYQCQTVQPEAERAPSSGRQETLLCFRCKHKTTVTHDVKLLLATVGCGPYVSAHLA